MIDCQITHIRNNPMIFTFMKNFSKNLVLVCLLFLTSLTVYGQQVGIVKTERTSPIGIVSFSPTSKLTGISNTKHVDGYVEKNGTDLFVFPVGQNGVYRPFVAAADGVT